MSLITFRTFHSCCYLVKPSKVNKLIQNKIKSLDFISKIFSYILQWWCHVVFFLLVSHAINFVFSSVIANLFSSSTLSLVVFVLFLPIVLYLSMFAIFLCTIHFNSQLFVQCFSQYILLQSSFTENVCQHYNLE